MANLEETALWKLYIEQVPEKDSNRRIWVKKVYDNAVTYLKYVCDTFPNYTLHDEKHVLNVIYAMGAILGDQIGNLSVGEVELLILAAALHDIGMVYDEADRQNAFKDERKSRRFLQENCPELIGVSYNEWPEKTRQWYLRTLHPFRLPEILNKGEWKKLFSARPREIVPKENIIAVCQSHGENVSTIKNNESLKYLDYYATDSLFCAMLLRLADLLDFDDTRTPQILFKYAEGNEESIKEWKKHMSSNGFRYPQTPSNDKLIFSAECKEPGEEFSVRDFLDWIDDELINCGKLQRQYQNNWQREFPFPHSVSRDNITSVGYVSDKFMLTMDQQNILKLLTGENLYDSNDVFIRELIQNAVDAVLLRGKMDNNFKVEDARIDLWEWNDDDGNIWFRIDDQGTGMTLGMLKKYFLKVGNSYYTSKELKKDLRSHSVNDDYFGISRFGIGFLSCFLCGMEAEVSTLYFDDNKSRNEYDIRTDDKNGYGLRMQITGLCGYYTLRSQAGNHIINKSLPAPMYMDSVEHPNLEYNGYRSKAGTSIVIKLDPGKLGAIDLKSTVEKYIHGTHMPFFYNGQKIGYTYSEIMEVAHNLKGENVIELSETEKEAFDKAFPNIKGQYPKIVITVVPLDTEEYQVIPNLSGIILKYSLRFDHYPQWQAKDQTYTISTSFLKNNKVKSFFLEAINLKGEPIIHKPTLLELYKAYGEENTNNLIRALDRFTTCPTSADELGDSWLPFAGENYISDVWWALVDESQNAIMDIKLNKGFNPSLEILTDDRHCRGITCIYQGVFAGDFYISNRNINFGITFFFENELQPIVDIGRTKVSGLPTKALVAICGIICHPNLDCLNHFNLYLLTSIGGITLPKWRDLFQSKVGEWLLETQNKYVDQIKEFLQAPLKDHLIHIEGDYNLKYVRYLNAHLTIIFKLVSTFFQDNYDMEICYETGQIVVFNKKEDTRYDDIFEKFPPMMFCKARSNQSRKYLCCSYMGWRRGITLDHPFTKWLFENVIKIESYFPRQFQQIVDSLCNDDADEIIKTVSEFRWQITKLNSKHGINIASLPELTKEDFWDPFD